MSTSWRNCNSCKSEIAFGVKIWNCNVSTCNRKRTALVFCSVSCWEAHLPLMRHRDAWAVEAQAPSQAEWDRQRAQDTDRPAPKTATRTEPAVRKKVAAPPATTQIPDDILIVASKLKKYIRARSGMNTSDTVLEALSDHVRRIAERAMESANEAGRKTVLDRDIPPLS